LQSETRHQPVLVGFAIRAEHGDQAEDDATLCTGCCDDFSWIFAIFGGIENTGQNDEREPTGGWMKNVLTDIHFWVPVAVLVGGLLLLKSIQ